MSEKLTPWIDGFYYNKNFSPELLKVQGNEVDFYNIVYLDFPDIEPRAVAEYDRSRIFDIRPKPKTLIQKIRPSAEGLSRSRSYGTIGFCGKQNGYLLK